MSVSLRPLDGLDWLSNFLGGSHAVLGWLVEMIVHLNSEVTLAPLQSRPLLISKWAIFLLLPIIKWLSEVTFHRWRYWHYPMLLLFNYGRLCDNLSKFWSFFQIAVQWLFLIVWRTDNFGRARWRIRIVLSFSTDTFLRLDRVKLFLKVIFLRLRHLQILYRECLYSVMKLYNVSIMLLL